jgi:hypothetical protein
MFNGAMGYAISFCDPADGSSQQDFVIYKCYIAYNLVEEQRKEMEKVRSEMWQNVPMTRN